MNHDVGLTCACVYEHESIPLLLGESFHPGGLAGSRRLLELVGLSPDARILDLACGIGTTAIEIAQHHGARVVAVDLGAKNLERGREAARSAGVEDRIEFVHASATDLPFAERSFDAVVCECALSTFADKPAVVAEMVRVLRPEGRIAISDMVVNAELPAELIEAVGPWTCVSDALSRRGYEGLFEAQGLRVEASHDESPALLTMARDLERKLALLGLGQLSGALPVELEFDRSRVLLRLARDQVQAGHVEYWRMAFAGPSARPLAPELSGGSARPSCDPRSGCC